VLKALNSATGIDLSYYKPANLNRRIRRRMLLGQIAGFEDYARLRPTSRPRPWRSVTTS
jgi:chemotaxis methyl-accepting protein methylase